MTMVPEFLTRPLFCVSFELHGLGILDQQKSKMD